MIKLRTHYSRTVLLKQKGGCRQCLYCPFSRGGKWIPISLWWEREVGLDRSLCQQSTDTMPNLQKQHVLKVQHVQCLCLANTAVHSGCCLQENKAVLHCLPVTVMGPRPTIAYTKNVVSCCILSKRLHTDEFHQEPVGDGAHRGVKKQKELIAPLLFFH